DSFQQMRQAFTLTRQNDARLVPYLVLTVVAVATVIYLLMLLITGSVWLPILPALLFGLIAALFLFSRRAQSSAYRQAEGQAGAAAYVLGQLRGDWHKTDAVAGTPQLDAVHRLLGRPGVVLIGEGAPQRVKPLLAQEKKRVARLAGDAPIYDVVVGRGEGEVPLAKLNTHLMKLPRNLSKEQVVALDRRLAALGAQRAPLPQGPMPGGAKMRSVQRAARRRG
ncbi:MAG: hypothetical protein QOE23_2075, partial [Pseudonocardiales bacterium]|nr:hypothetical protein [Pseudonocardiales bacterium]